MPQNYYDNASRFAVKLDPTGFLGWLLGVPPDGLVVRGWLDVRGVPFPGDPDRTGDTVVRLENPHEHGVPWAVAVEFQTKPDPEMFGRLLGYLSGLWLALRPDVERGSRFHVGAAVVNLTGVGRASRDMRWPGTGLATHLGVVERNLERDSAVALLDGIEAGQWSRCLLPWVPLMAGGDAMELASRWRSMAEGEPNSRRRAEYGGIALLFAGRVGCREVWDKALGGWNVEESAVVNDWIAVGEKRGEARGEARGRVEAARANVIRVGTKRFGTGPTEAHVSVLSAITDPAALADLLDRSLDVATWDELLVGR